MEVNYFNIEFNFREGAFKASCQKFQMHNYPQIRVAVDRGKKGHDIYTFYHLNGEKHCYFWFKLPDKRQDIAGAIARCLEKFEEA